jgi:hypothetical protein
MPTFERLSGHQLSIFTCAPPNTEHIIEHLHCARPANQSQPRLQRLAACRQTSQDDGRVYFIAAVAVTGAEPRILASAWRDDVYANELVSLMTFTDDRR